jgi:ferredoxin
MTKQPSSPGQVAPATATSRRKFITLSSLFTVTTVLRAQILRVEGGLAPIIPKATPRRALRISPPGSRGLREFARHCTGCQLCVTVCPNQVLRTADRFGAVAQPEMHFDQGYCRPECTRCTDACPTGAIRHLSVAEKASLQIGHAVVKLDLCIVNRDKVQCTTCFRHCPPHAVHLIRQGPLAPQAAMGPAAMAHPPHPLMIPVVDTERCIGCGACEYLCPSRPQSAIHVEGHERHRFI